MNKLDKAIKNAMLTYPTVYPTRERFLSHVFLVIGNGYDWNNGVLVSYGDIRVFKNREEFVSDIDKRITHAIEQSDKRIKEYNDESDPFDKLDEETLKKVTDREAERLAERLEDLQDELKTRYDMFDNIKKYVAAQATEYKNPGYYEMNICKPYAKICNIPDDIEESWLDGAIEIAELLLPVNPNFEQILIDLNAKKK
jgi:hypothetical protein